jgi:hypothetical protein
MTAGAAYEWEMETEPKAPIEEARSVFVKGGKDQEPVELISAWYTVTKDSHVPGRTRWPVVPRPSGFEGWELEYL